MTVDTQLEQDSIVNEQKRAVRAEDTYQGLTTKEIGNLQKSDITTANAPFIAGLYLGRDIERNYLYTFFSEAREGDNVDPSGYRKYRISLGKLRQIMTDAQSGNFRPIKGYIEQESDFFQALSEDDLGQTEEQSEQYKRTSLKLKMVQQNIPDSSDGSVVKSPNPAWMEEPAPLRIQLQMLKESKLT